MSYENVQKVNITQPILVEYYVGSRLSVDFGYKYQSYLMASVICLGEFPFKQLLLWISVRIQIFTLFLFYYWGLRGVIVYCVTLNRMEIYGSKSSHFD